MCIRDRYMAVGHLLSLVSRRGTHCQNVYVIPLLVLLFLPVFWKHSSSQSTCVSSALEALAMMRYINLRFTLHYITIQHAITTFSHRRTAEFQSSTYCNHTATTTLQFCLTGPVFQSYSRHGQVCQNQTFGSCAAGIFTGQITFLLVNKLIKATTAVT